LNNDGKLDVAMIIPQDSFGTVYIGTALGNGNGTFQAARQQSGSSVLESAYLISHDIDLADADGDGDIDVLVTNDASNDVSLFLNTGDGSVLPHQRYGIGYSPLWSCIADFTGDGVADVASVYSLPPSGSQNVISVLRGLSATPPATVVARKMHGTAGPFDIALPLVGPRGVESRSGGPDREHQIVFTFPGPVTFSDVTVTPQGNGTASLARPPSVSADGKQVSLDLTNVSNAQTLTVTLSGVNGSGIVTVPVGILLGDTNATGGVNAGDALQTRNRSGHTADPNNFRSDVNHDGQINSGDSLVVRANSGASLP
jgi:hypothetical protein